MKEGGYEVIDLSLFTATMTNLQTDTDSGASEGHLGNRDTIDTLSGASIH
ncbi:MULTISPECIES: hypothetical protein [Streptococcus]|nr:MULTISPECIES: hypothetical protein [Streptococcus]MBF0775805.1 hypothetical protein [Streptococcus sp. 19428wD3_AN2]